MSSVKKVYSIIYRVIFCSDMHGPQRMNPTDFSGLLAFHQAPALVQHLNTWQIQY